MGHFHRLHCQSIVSIHEADRMLHRWTDAMAKLIRNPAWSSQERALLARYGQFMAVAAPQYDATYPHHLRFYGTMRECILYYIGYWVGRFRELYIRQIEGEFSPRAWGLLRKPLAELERDTLPMIYATKDGNRYALNLG